MKKKQKKKKLPPPVDWQNILTTGIVDLLVGTALILISKLFE